MPCRPLFRSAAALLLAAGCAPQRFDSAAAGQRLLKQDAEWADLASAGKDIDRIVSYWSDDAVVIPQGQPTVEGKAAIRAFVATSLQTPGFTIHWVSDKVTFSPDGKLAYLRSTNEMTVPGPTGTSITVPGRGISIWRLEPDGQWRCVVDIWNDPPGASPAGQ
jgi:ketosteroid isomerase-like protein